MAARESRAPGTPGGPGPQPPLAPERAAEHSHASPQVASSQRGTCVDETTPTPSPHEPDGRFAAGNAGGPGRPKGRRTTELRRAAEEAVTPDMVRGVLRKVAMQALQGNLAAARILLARTLRRPRA